VYLKSCGYNKTAKFNGVSFPEVSITEIFLHGLGVKEKATTTINEEKL